MCVKYFFTLNVVFLCKNVENFNAQNNTFSGPYATNEKRNERSFARNDGPKRARPEKVLFSYHSASFLKSIIEILGDFWMANFVGGIYYFLHVIRNGKNPRIFHIDKF